LENENERLINDLKNANDEQMKDILTGIEEIKVNIEE
jgi:hypothetical protein